MWDALKNHPQFQTRWEDRFIATEHWIGVPKDFSYPWGEHWKRATRSVLGGGVRPKSRPRYATRRMRAADRRMLNRIISSKPPEPPHPDQLRLF